MMTSKTLQSHKNNQQESLLFADRVIAQIQEQTRAELATMQDAFELLGWQELTDEIKVAIYEDVKFMVMELQGLFSSCDEYVKRRRDSVHFWVSSFLDGICDEKMVIENLQIK
jgi:hypothetical protein